MMVADPNPWDIYPNWRELDYYIGLNNLVKKSSKEVTESFLKIMNIHLINISINTWPMPPLSLSSTY